MFLAMKPSHSMLQFESEFSAGQPNQNPVEHIHVPTNMKNNLESLIHNLSIGFLRRQLGSAGSGHNVDNFQWEGHHLRSTGLLNVRSNATNAVPLPQSTAVRRLSAVTGASPRMPLQSLTETIDTAIQQPFFRVVKSSMDHYKRDASTPYYRGRDEKSYANIKEKSAELQSSDETSKRLTAYQRMTQATTKAVHEATDAKTITKYEYRQNSTVETSQSQKPVSYCYENADKETIERARQYAKQRRELKDDDISNGYQHAKSRDSDHYSWKSSVKNHHTIENQTNDTPKFREYVRDGKVQEGFLLADEIVVEKINEKTTTLDVYNVDTGKWEKEEVDANSVYGIMKRCGKGTLIFHKQSFIDIEDPERKVKSGIYLHDVKELGAERRERLGYKDAHGIDVSGYIIFVNEQEPGKGTIPLRDYLPENRSILRVVAKSDLGRYVDSPALDDNKQKFN